MKRNDFIKSFALGAVAVAVAPEILANTKPKYDVGEWHGGSEDKLVISDNIIKAHQTISDFINNDLVIVKSEYTLITLVVPVDIPNYSSLEESRSILFKNKIHPNCKYISQHSWKQPVSTVYFEFKTQQDKCEFLQKLNSKNGNRVFRLTLNSFFEHGEPSDVWNTK